ncbi:hypothetical protein ILUMI_00663 [Ignelater luminosus]|uniref:SCP domain-containing protein n=1 Tax=Ignelater luminosus TaxID=2038154 RepID=A0A8K0GL06_IGNLU|nr:hypothetical protein ILUMI_00663 [Ignelater luminosus]
MNKTIILLYYTFFVVINAAEILEKGVSKENKKEIVDAHNELRLKLVNGQVPNQPRATDMKEMCWDEQLAKEAQRIANKLIFKHALVDDDRWISIGQNLAQRGSSVDVKNPSWESIVNDWFNEVKLYKYGPMYIHGTGHYTQVVWARTTQVGCGYVRFIDRKKKLPYRRLYVCNYGPGGNIDGVPPYKTGRCGCVGLCKTKCS